MIIYAYLNIRRNVYYNHNIHAYFAPKYYKKSYTPDFSTGSLYGEAIWFDHNKWYGMIFLIGQPWTDLN